MIENSEVWTEFLKIMAETDKVTPAKNPYAEDKKIIEEKREFPKEDLIEEAHPEKIYVAEARGDGGLVENQNEQHEKMMSVINKMPTGALLGTYASVVNSLVKMANTCDEEGNKEMADKLTDMAKQVLALMDVHPFKVGTRVSGEVSPLYKEAVPIGLFSSSFRLGWKLLDKAVPAIIGKLFSTVGEVGGDTLRALKIMARPPVVEEVASGVAKDMGSILKDLPGEVSNIAREVSGKFAKTLEDANAEVNSLIKSFKSTAQTAIDESNTAQKEYIAAQQALEEAGALTKDSQAVRTQAARVAESRVVDASHKAQSLQQQQPLFDALSVAKTPEDQLKALESISSFQGQRIDVDAAKKVVTDAAKTISDVQKADATGQSNTAFFSHVITELKSGHTDELGNFLMNKNNAERMQKLLASGSRRDRVLNLLKAKDGVIPDLSIMTRFLGITAEHQIGSLLGVGAVGASGVILANVYGWFGKHNPAVTEAEVKVDIQEPLSRLRVYGPGQNIVNRVKTSCDDLIQLQQMAIDGLQNNPAALTKYISGMSSEIKTLIDATNQWNTVELSADDKSVAIQAKKQIIDFITQQIQKFNELAVIVGVPTMSAPTSTSTSPGNKADDNITKIQAALKLQETGTIDGPTTQALRQLEQNFNKKSKDTAWSGAFVDPSKNFIIDYGHLQEAFERIKKY